jgi:hypothetical protein
MRSGAAGASIAEGSGRRAAVCASASAAAASASAPVAARSRSRLAFIRNRMVAGTREIAYDLTCPGRAREERVPGLRGGPSIRGVSCRRAVPGSGKGVLTTILTVRDLSTWSSRGHPSYWGRGATQAHGLGPALGPSVRDLSTVRRLVGDLPPERPRTANPTGTPRAGRVRRSARARFRAQARAHTGPPST